MSSDRSSDWDSVPLWPLFAGLYHLVSYGEEQVTICTRGRFLSVTGRDAWSQLPPLLGALDGRNTRAELDLAYPGLARLVLPTLARKGLLVEAGGWPSGGKVRGLAATLGLSPAISGQQLARATVLISGCGPVGGTVAMQLAKAGVGRLILADATTLSPSDVASSPILAPRTEGMLRVQATLEKCTSLTSISDIQIAKVPLSPSIVKGCDIVVLAGPPQVEGLLSEGDLCLEQGVPYLQYEHDEASAIIGPLVRRGGRPCHRCVEARRRSHVVRPELDSSQRNHVSTLMDSSVLLSAYVSLIAGLIAAHILTHLTKPEFARAGDIDVIDLQRLKVVRKRVTHVSDCGCNYQPRSGGSDGQRPL